MDVAEHVEALAREGDRLANAAEAAGLDATVPTCPDWQVRDLLGHLGQVHRWATVFVATARATPAGDDDLSPVPGDADLVSWFRAGHAALVGALRAADPSLECWTFLRAPSPLAFWARRQAHETTIHRVDAQSAAGAVTGVAPGFAADGIDELVMGFFGRPSGRLHADPPVRLGVRASDTGDAWSIEIGPDTRTVSRGDASGDCVVHGPASDVYLMLWNRRDTHGIDIDGDDRVLALWRDKARIRWR